MAGDCHGGRRDSIRRYLRYGLSTSPPLGLKGNVGRSYRAPNFSELYFSQGLMVGNPDLKPEEAFHYDAGLRLDFSPWVFVEGAFFRSEVRHLIEYLLISGFRYVPYNFGRATITGIELSWRMQPVDWFSLAGAYTFTDAIDETDDPNRKGKRIPGRPPHVGFARAEGHAGLVRPFVEYNYVGENYITQANTKVLAAREIWNAGVVFVVAPGRRIGWEVKNLSDQRAVDVRGFPLPGRAFYLSLEYGF